MMTFTIITPSLQRESLIHCCESVDCQTYPKIQHVIALDCPPEEVNDTLLDRIRHSGREVFCCGKRFGNFGNHARWMAWKYCTGDYILYLDDDNTLHSDHTLDDIASALESASQPPFAIFPIHRHGRIFFHDPPGMCMTDTLNIVARREIGRWPDIVAREADGHWVERMKLSHPYVAFPNVEPIGLMEKSSNGV